MCRNGQVDFLCQGLLQTVLYFKCQSDLNSYFTRSLSSLPTNKVNSAFLSLSTPVKKKIQFCVFVYNSGISVLTLLCKIKLKANFAINKNYQKLTYMYNMHILCLTETQVTIFYYFKICFFLQSMTMSKPLISCIFYRT